MQAVKDKLHEMNAMRKVKAEARAEEKAEKDIAKARMEVAHEVRLAKEAEAAMDLHVARAGERVDREIAKHSSKNPEAAAAINSMDAGASMNSRDADLGMNSMDATTMEAVNEHTPMAN